jgi:hypothetical protein
MLGLSDLAEHGAPRARGAGSDHRKSAPGSGAGVRGEQCEGRSSRQRNAAAKRRKTLSQLAAALNADPTATGVVAALMRKALKREEARSGFLPHGRVFK